MFAFPIFWRGGEVVEGDLISEKFHISTACRWTSVQSSQNKQNHNFIWGVIIERKILLVSKIKSVWRSFLFQMSSGRANINMTCSLWGKVRVEQIFCPISMVSQVSDSLEIFYFILSLIMSRHRQAYFNLLDMKFFVPFIFKAEKNIGDHQQFCFWKCSEFNYIQKFLGNSGMAQ